MPETTATIIITRPQPYADQLADELSSLSVEVVTAPLIEFEANSDFDPASDFSASESADYLIFVSQQAANYYLQALSDEQLATVRQKTLIAVGKATRAVIENFDMNAEVPTTFDSEGILELIEQFNEQQDSLNLLLICGNQGRELLEQSLSEQHQLTRLETYQRIAIEQSFPAIANNTAIIVTSEQLLNLSLQQLEQQTSDQSLQQSVAFICASSRIKDKAEALGVANCIVANSATNSDLVAACLEWQQSLQTNNDEPLAQSEAMSESDKHENELIEALELDQEPDNSDSKPAKKKKGLFKPFVLLLVVAAIAYAAFWLWQQGYFQDSAAEPEADELSRLVNAEQSIVTQAQLIENLSKQLNSQTSDYQAQQQELVRQVESLQQQLIASQRKFQSMTADAENQARDWQIAEAEYLIRQAAQKIHYSNDTGSIVALLEAADQQIVASGDSNLLALRRAISQDIAQIKASAVIDIEGILVKLDTIQAQIPKLTLASVSFQPPADAKVVEQTESLDKSAWQTFKNNMKDTFSDYYKVHHYDQSVKPFINPQQAELLQQNILLTLKTAQLSALRHQQVSYDKAVAELTDWVQEFYQQDATSQVVLEQLALLKTAKISVQLPSALQSLDFIKQNNQERLNQWLQSPTIESEQPAEESEEGAETEDPQTDEDGVQP